MRQQREGFAMLTAIVVVVMMALVGSLVVSLSGKMIKNTTLQYREEQAALLAKSYTEYAIMAVMTDDRTANGECLSDIGASNILGATSNGGYQVRVLVGYIGGSANDNDVSMCATSRRFSTSVAQPSFPLHVIIDVYIEYRDFDRPNKPWITYHKRTLQKI